jgi:hypothetical protein
MSKDLLQDILEKMKKVEGGYLDQDEKGQGEQDFIDKHVDNVDVTDAPAVKAQKGHPHDAGSKAKMAPRKKHRKGYEPGEDAEVYESDFENSDLSQILENVISNGSEEDLTAFINETIDEFLQTEASLEETALLEEMLSTEEGCQEFINWIFEEDEEDEDCCEACGKKDCKCNVETKDGNVDTNPKITKKEVDEASCSSGDSKAKKKYRKEDIERHSDFKMIKTKTPEGKVIWKRNRPETEVSKKTD